MNYKSIKKLSKQINKDNYLNALGLVGIGLIITAAFCALPFMIRKLFIGNFSTYSVIFLFISSVYYVFRAAYSAGETAWYSGRITRRKDCYKRFIFWLKPKYVFKAIRLKTLLFLIKSTVTIVFVSPALLTILFAINLAFTGGIEVSVFAALIIGGFVLMLVGLIFSFIINQRFFLAKYLLSDNPKLGVFQVIKQSNNLTEGQLHYIVKFRLGFIPWFLLCLLIFPTIYVYPHYKQSSCIIAKELRL